MVGGECACSSTYSPYELAPSHQKPPSRERFLCDRNKGARKKCAKWLDVTSCVFTQSSPTCMSLCAHLHTWPRLVNDLSCSPWRAVTAMTNRLFFVRVFVCFTLW